MALTELCLEAAEAAQPRLNALLSIRAEQALAQARRADSELDAGQNRGPLHGVPLAHKDIFYRAGAVTTAGSRLLSEFVPSRTSPVIARLDEAGAVDIGTLNLAEFCVGPTGQNDHTGSCFNPWDTARVPGGSSSGSAAAVAARVVFGSVGSDTGGSIRLPAALCGVTGLKPTFGRVSLRDAVERCWSLDVFGPIARTADDAALILQAIAGHDPLDRASVPAGVPDYAGGLAEGWRGVRIAVPEDWLDAADSEIAQAHRDVLGTFESMGTRVTRVAPVDRAKLYRLTTVINDTEATFLHREAIERRPEAFNGSTLSRIDRGFSVSALDYAAALRGQFEERVAFERAFLDKADLLYTPATDCAPPTMQSVSFSDPGGADDVVPRLTAWTRWVSYLGLPAIAFPVGATPSGLPLAGQLVGRAMAEGDLLAVVDRFQRVTEWHQRRPAGF